MKREYSGPAIDAGYQHISEAPAYRKKGETVYATDPEPKGTESVENVPIPRTRPDVDGQSTFGDWGWLQ